MSIFDALSRVPKILEANVNAAIHPDPKNNVTIPNIEPNTVNFNAKELKPSTVDRKPKDVAAAVSDLEKELMEESHRPTPVTDVKPESSKEKS